MVLRWFGDEQWVGENAVNGNLEARRQLPGKQRRQWGSSHVKWLRKGSPSRIKGSSRQVSWRRVGSPQVAWRTEGNTEKIKDDSPRWTKENEVLGKLGVRLQLPGKQRRQSPAAFEKMSQNPDDSKGRMQSPGEMEKERWVGWKEAVSRWAGEQKIVPGKLEKTIPAVLDKKRQSAGGLGKNTQSQLEKRSPRWGRWNKAVSLWPREHGDSPGRVREEKSVPRLIG